MYIYKLYVSFSDQTYVTVIIGPGGRWSAGIRDARGLMDAYSGSEKEDIIADFPATDRGWTHLNTPSDRYGQIMKKHELAFVVVAPPDRDQDAAFDYMCKRTVYALSGNLSIEDLYIECLEKFNFHER